jgi:hypothetical protein
MARLKARRHCRLCLKPYTSQHAVTFSLKQKKVVEVVVVKVQFFPFDGAHLPK